MKEDYGVRLPCHAMPRQRREARYSTLLSSTKKGIHIGKIIGARVCKR
jgi:hypothetical protein